MVTTRRRGGKQRIYDLGLQARRGGNVPGNPALSGGVRLGREKAREWQGGKGFRL